MCAFRLSYCYGGYFSFHLKVSWLVGLVRHKFRLCVDQVHSLTSCEKYDKLNRELIWRGFGWLPAGSKGLHTATASQVVLKIQTR